MEFPMIDGPSESPGDSEFFGWETYFGHIVGLAMSSTKRPMGAQMSWEVIEKHPETCDFYVPTLFFCVCVPKVDDVLRCFQLPFGNLEL